MTPLFPPVDHRPDIRLHEAAHAVVATVCGLEVHDLEVDERGGRTIYRVRGASMSTTAELEADLVSSLAGAEASRVAAGPGRFHLVSDEGSDGDHARTTARRLEIRKGEPYSAVMRAARHRTAVLVTRHWPEIDRLARAIAIAGDRLVGAEAEAAVAEAFAGRVWRRPIESPIPAATAYPTTPGPILAVPDRGQSAAWRAALAAPRGPDARRPSSGLAQGRP